MVYIADLHPCILASAHFNICATRDTLTERKNYPPKNKGMVVQLLLAEASAANGLTTATAQSTETSSCNGTNRGNEK